MLVVGDRLLAVDHQPLPATSLVDAVNAKQGAPVILDVMRGDQTLTLTLTPEPSQGRWLLGIRVGVAVDYASDPGAAAGAAAAYPLAGVIARVRGIYQAIAGGDRADPGGPMRMTEEYRGARPPYSAALLAILYAGYLWLLLAIIDLVRLVRTPT